MLVVSRKVDQDIIIHTADGDIIVGIVGIRPGQVQIGIKAPEHVVVNRRRTVTPHKIRRIVNGQESK